MEEAFDLIIGYLSPAGYMLMKRRSENLPMLSWEQGEWISVATSM